MSAQFLLDTNILSELIRHPRGTIAEKIRESGETEICTSIIVACELRYGAAKRNAVRLSDRVEAILDAIEVVPFGEEADRHYASIRWQLSRDGRLIGPNDLLIAAHARSLNITLVTANVREFSRVPYLRTLNWL